MLKIIFSHTKNVEAKSILKKKIKPKPKLQLSLLKANIHEALYTVSHNSPAMAEARASREDQGKP